VNRLLICDDSVEARRLLRTLLGGHPEIEIVGEASNGLEVVELAEELAPDVVLMDFALPGIDGAEATRRIREKRPETRVIAFTGLDDSGIVQSMLEAGASSVCVKGAPLWELERAIAGASQPLLRLAHTLARPVSERALMRLVARETADMTGAVLVGAYVAGDIGIATAAVAGPAGLEVDEVEPQPSEIPEVVRRAHVQSEAVWAGGRELVEIYRLFGIPGSAALAVPLITNGERLGVLLTIMPANVQFELDVELVRALADIASGALGARRKLALSDAEARRDALTGLGNRRAFEEHLDRSLREAEADAQPLALILLDLDDFKQTNDTLGHAEGDRALIALSRILVGHTRPDEQTFRIGGDELAVVMHGDSHQAAAAAERLRAAVVGQRRLESRTTVSAGIAAFPEHASTKEELVRRADAALYTAKEHGKDRVAVYAADHERPIQPAPQLVAVTADVESHQLQLPPAESHTLRLLVVDDQPNLRMLLRTTFEIVDVDVDEAGTAAEAEGRIKARRPDVIVLDVALPDLDGIALCRRLKADPETAAIPIVLLTGTGLGEDEDTGADAFIHKPFSPLELLETIERVAGRLPEGPYRLMVDERPDEQLLLYAQDLRRLLEIERTQRTLIQAAYEETVTALARALESKDIGTGAHSQRVMRYALELAQKFDPNLLEDPSLEYGFLLHDVGKIGIPDGLLQKRGPLTDAERRVIQTHTVLGEQILQRVPLLQGQGLAVIRSHHERWDGSGYPDRLEAGGIPVGARIFAVSDALDAMTTNRPYRRAGAWSEAVDEILAQSGHQFDPTVVETFAGCEPQLRRIYYELGAA
jgi:diguanylate cyclase (GGDEF)-like protein